MKQLITTLLAVFLFHSVFGQQIISGNYDDGLKLSYDSVSKKITGYFEDYSGSDEQTNNPRFSCTFYLEGVVSGQRFTIKTYYPADKKDDLILGTMEIATNKKVSIKLPKEHGGCWNVQHFADRLVSFSLERSQTWMQIRYVNTAKAYFYSDNSEDKRLKSYLVIGNFVCIEKIEGSWAYCTYIGKKTTKGWLKLSDLNNL
ncbi:MAG TPA: hypothetical protein VNS32_06455 [Flavisolibacter sp.]|nr:hypothetical protein [Flavisolibacter sp.]